MKNLIFCFVISIIHTYIFAIDLSGKYICTGYDSKDGAMKGVIVTLKINSNNSDIIHDIYSYIFKMQHNDELYNGSAVSVGSSLAISFNNIKDKDDHGVGMATVNYDWDNKGKIQDIKLNKFYYEPNYISHGVELCIKQK